MREMADRRLADPYRRWIDRALPLPPEVVLLPRAIDVGKDAVAFAGVTLTLGVMGVFFLMMATRVDPATDGWPPLLITAGVGVALWIAPVLLLARLVRTIGARRDRERGTLRQGIFIGAEGVLVRMEPNGCHPIPAQRFVSAKLIGHSRKLSHVSRRTVAVETLDGTIRFFADQLQGHPARVAQAAGELWPAGTWPKPAARSKRKVKVDHSRTEGVRRAAALFGYSILAFFVALGLLKIGGGLWSNPAVRATVLILLLVIAAAAAHIFFQFVRMRAFYRCPQCRARPAVVPEAFHEIRYFCAACNVEWKTGLEEKDLGD